MRLDAKVDPSLLGGLVVKIGSRMFDSSLRTKLSNLKVVLKGTADRGNRGRKGLSRGRFLQGNRPAGVTDARDQAL